MESHWFFQGVTGVPADSSTPPTTARTEYLAVALPELSE